MILIVTYDLKGAAGSYDDFFEALKSQGSWSHYLRSTWLISTTKSTREVFEEVQPFIRSGDHILIARMGKDRQGWLPKRAWEWIKRHDSDT